jgi:hypothetical protein
MSHQVHAERDAVTLDQLSELLAEQAALTAEITALYALLAGQPIAQNDPVTVQYLDSLPSSAPGAPNTHAPGADLQLSNLTTELLSRLEAHGRSGHLALVTLTAPPSAAIAPLIDSQAPGVLGCWFVVEATLAGQHVHGLLLADSERTAREFPELHAERHGLSPDAQDCAPEQGPLTGWKTRGKALRRGVFNVARYALALERHAKKRKHEVPVQVLASGIFFGVESLADFALSRPELCPPSVTAPSAPVLCACGCGQPPRHGSRYTDARHAARQRQREHRARLRAVTPEVMSAERDRAPNSGVPLAMVAQPTPESVTPQADVSASVTAEPRHAPELSSPIVTPVPATMAEPEPVTASGHVPESVTDPVERAARQAVEKLGPDGDLERETLRILLGDFEEKPSQLALNQAVTKALRFVPVVMLPPEAVTPDPPVTEVLA